MDLFQLRRTLNNTRNRDGTYVLSMIDCFTSYVIAVPVVSKDTLVVAQAFYRSLILVHGVPDRLTSDGGGEFVSRLMQRLNAWLQTEYHQTTPIKPSSNGKVESWHRLLLRVVRTFLQSFDDDANWDDLVPIAVWAHNTTPCDSHGHTPFELIFGRSPRWQGDSASRMDQFCVPERNEEEWLQHSMQLRDAAFERVRNLVTVAKEQARADTDTHRRDKHYQERVLGSNGDVVQRGTSIWVLQESTR